MEPIRLTLLCACFGGAVALLVTLPLLKPTGLLRTVLVLYALLPIVRNTHAGIVGIRPGMRAAALALGLSARDRLLSVELPLAAPTLLAGIKTSAVINVGTATLALPSTHK
jgi:osmoprotectant transport system permease protein